MKNRQSRVLTTAWLLPLSLLVIGCGKAETAGNLQKTDLSEVSKRLAKLESQIDELTSNDAGAKATSIGASLSAKQNGALQALDAFVDSALQDVPSIETVERKTAAFNDLNQEMHPDVQLANVGRLVAVQWNLAAVEWLARNNIWQSAADNPRAERISEAQRLMDRSDVLLTEPPSSIESQLFDRLTERQTALDQLATRRKRKWMQEEAIALVEQLRTFERGKEDKALEKLEVFIAAAELDYLQDEPEHEAIQNLLALRQQFQLRKSIERLQEQYDHLKDAQLTDRLRQPAHNQLLQSAVAIHSQLVLNGEAQPFEEELLDLQKIARKLSLESEVESKRLIEQREKVRSRYQSWALGQVVKVRSSWTVASVDKRLNIVLSLARNGKAASLRGAAEFPSFRVWVNGKAGTKLTNGVVSPLDGKKIVNWLGSYLSDDTKRVSQRLTREAMIKWMLPIDARLLDQPVAEIYSQTWAELWASLEGAETDHRLAIAQAAVTASKFGLDNFPNKETAN